MEALIRYRWDGVELAAGYTYLDKDADYGSAVVDASFYALNYATHRATVATEVSLSDRIRLLFDSEYRRQEKNPLRTSSSSAFLASAAVVWDVSGPDGFSLALTADNLMDDDYQFFPGTPAVGRQVSLSVSYRW